MSQTPNETEAQFDVMFNNEEQYSLWPVDKTVLTGWCKSGKQGSKAACLAYINEVWTDMRPLSVRTPAAALDAGAYRRSASITTAPSGFISGPYAGFHDEC